jgi:hypothetical protein
MPTLKAGQVNLLEDGTGNDDAVWQLEPGHRVSVTLNNGIEVLSIDPEDLKAICAALVNMELEEEQRVKRNKG